jgi:membrane protease YdiL (CAAX protease family)
MNNTVPQSKLINPASAIAVIIFLWLAYTIIQTLSVTGDLTPSWSLVLSFLPGILGVVVLRASGWSSAQLYLRSASLSRGGFFVLAAVFLLALAAIIPFGQWEGWNWKVALLDAPASGISQELFFRASLLPVCLMAWKARPRLALTLHSLLFALWHIGPLFVGAPIWAVLAVMLVPFISGLGWGWQVQRDGTVFWAMLQHALIWVIAGQFPMPA